MHGTVTMMQSPCIFQKYSDFATIIVYILKSTIVRNVERCSPVLQLHIWGHAHHDVYATLYDCVQQWCCWCIPFQLYSTSDGSGDKQVQSCGPSEKIFITGQNKENLNQIFCRYTKGK
jgi:hypothetical protein